MARIRSIKPEFWTSEQVVDCSTTARLLFIGLWTFCDDQGVHPASVVRLKMEVFPGDQFTGDDIADLVDELRSAKLVSQYEAQSKAWWAVTGWRHQKIQKPTHLYPPPQSDDGSDTVRRPVDDQSGNGNGAVTPGVESSRVESSRVESRSDHLRTGTEAPENSPSLALRKFWRGSSAIAMGVKLSDDQIRTLIATAGLLALGMISEQAITSGCEAVVHRSEGSPRDPVKYFVSVVMDEQAKQGRDFQAMLASVDVPDSMIEEWRDATR